MSSTGPLLAQVAAEYGNLLARDAFTSLGNLISSAGTELILIGLGILAGLYLLTRLM